MNLDLQKKLSDYTCMPGHQANTFMLCLQPGCKQPKKICCQALCVPYYHKNHKVIEIEAVEAFLSQYLQLQKPTLHDSVIEQIELIRTLQAEINSLIEAIIEKLSTHFGRFSYHLHKLAVDMAETKSCERISQLSQDMIELCCINDKLIKVKVIRPIEPLTVDADLKDCILRLAGFSIGKHDAQASKPEDQVNFYHSHQRVLKADGEIWCLDVAKHGILASAGNDRKVTFWNMDTAERLWSSQKHSSTITAIAFSFDSALLISGSQEGDIKIWNLEKQKLLKKIKAHNGNVSSISFSNNNKQIITAGWDLKIKLWTFKEESQVECLEFLPGHSDKIYLATFSPDNTYVASCSLDKSIRFWDTNALCQIGEPLSTHKERVDWLCFSLNGKFMASVSSIEGNFILWSTKNWEILWNHKPGHLPFRVIFSKDSKLLISAHRDVRVFDITTKAVVGEPVKAHNYFVWSMKQSKDGRYLITGCQDQTIKIYGLPK